MPTIAALVLGALAAAAPAHGERASQPASTTADAVVGGELPATPPDFLVGPRRAMAAAERSPTARALRERYRRLHASPEVAPGHWQVFYSQNGRRVGLITVDGTSGTVLDEWKGPQVDWGMARGAKGQFGHVLNAPYVWLPLCAVFLLGLLDFRRLRRIAHVDLLVLLGFGASHVYFNAAEIETSVLLTYPPLVYLLIRSVAAGLGRAGAPLRPSAPLGLLIVAVAALIGFRIAINVADSGVIDVGYAGVIGADRIVAGEPLYGEGAFPADNPTGDTYGPVAYLAYVPFELALPWSGGWDSLPAAHAASIFFDLAAIAGLLLLGSRLRPGEAGRRLGVVLAFAWAAFPYTAFALQSNSNDALVGALLIWTLVAVSSPVRSAAAAALASMAKLAPLALVPLLAPGRRGLRPLTDRKERPALLRRTGVFAAVFGGMLGAALVLPALDPGLDVLWERSFEAQLERDSPFSIWGQYELGALHEIGKIAFLAFAVSLAFFPRHRSPAQVAALAAAVLLAGQLLLEHWFYLYIPWWLGLYLVAIAADESRGVPGRDATTPPTGRRLSDAVAAAATR